MEDQTGVAEFLFKCIAIPEISSTFQILNWSLKTNSLLQIHLDITYIHDTVFVEFLSV